MMYNFLLDVPNFMTKSSFTENAMCYASVSEMSQIIRYKDRMI